MGLFWPEYWADVLGLIALILVCALQKFCPAPPTINTGMYNEKPLK